MCFSTKVVWNEFCTGDALVVPTNGILKADGSLVMGAGLAKEAAQRFPGLPQKAGEWILATEQIKKRGSFGEYYEYGFLPIPNFWPLIGRIGLFQSKGDWREISSTALLYRSAVGLILFSQSFHGTIHMPCPGIGLGGLDFKDIKNIFSPLPKNVIVYIPRQLETMVAV